MAKGWRMELPPSLGRDPVRARARSLAPLLYDAGFEMVATAESYAQIEERLSSGEADAAWGPPMVCARMEQAGGRVAFRGLRDGAPSYRAVLVARAGDRIDLSSPTRPRRRPRAAWVDKESMAGYLLPRAFLRRLGFDLKTFLISESFLGSYQACIDAVLDGTADLAATFAASSSGHGTDGYFAIAGPRAAELKTLGYSDECPNDGVVLSPRLHGPTADAIVTALRRLLADREARQQFALAFDVSGFEEPPAGSYVPLLEMFEPPGEAAS